MGKSRITHGMAKHPVYNVYYAMRNRCTNPNNSSYHRYGGRGIKVCPRWLDSFEHFYSDMGPRPEGYYIDRIDSDGNYTPENCRWVDKYTSAQNRDTSACIGNNHRWFTWNGKTLTIRHWLELTGTGRGAFYHRLNTGQSEEVALGLVK